MLFPKASLEAIMKKLVMKKGMTLIEIIIAIAILSIIAMYFLSTFVFGFKGIMNSGKNTKAAYIAQQGMENKIVDISSTPENVTSKVTPEYPEDPEEPKEPLKMKIEFDGVPEIIIEGRLVEIETKGEHKAEATMFIPD